MKALRSFETLGAANLVTVTSYKTWTFRAALLSEPEILHHFACVGGW
jgi:hypothetical protein